MIKILSILLLLFAPAISLAEPWDQPLILPVNAGPQVIYNQVEYQIGDLDSSDFVWSSSDPSIASISENGIIMGQQMGECTIIGQSKHDASSVQLDLILPSYVYSHDALSLDRPEGDFFYIQMIDSQLHFQGARTTSDAFSAETISYETIPGMYAVHLTPLKPGSGTLYYTINNTAFTVDVSVSENALIPFPTVLPPTLVPAPTSPAPAEPTPAAEEPIQTSADAGDYDYETALLKIDAYQDQTMTIEGSVFLVAPLQDGLYSAVLCLNDNLQQLVYIAIPAAVLPADGLHMFDQLTITGQPNGWNTTQIPQTILPEFTAEVIINDGPTPFKTYFSHASGNFIVPEAGVSSSTFSPEAAVAAAAQGTLGTDFMSCRLGSTGIFFIDAQANGIDGDGIRFNSSQKALDLMEKIREIDSEHPMNFKEIYFQFYTNLVDVYGNTTNEAVLSFSIFREDFDQINFENMLTSNLLKIAKNVYQAPALK